MNIPLLDKYIDKKVKFVVREYSKNVSRKGNYNE
jgi:hypothetical protein